MDATGDNKKIRRAAGLVLCLCGLALFLAAAVLTFSALGRLGENYLRFAQADLTEDFNDAVIYDDHLYAQLAFGIEILSSEPGKAERMDAFLAGAMPLIYERILAAGVLYTMLVTAAGALFLYNRWGRSPKKHTAAILLYPLAIYLLFLAVVFGGSAFRRIPVPALPREAVVPLVLSVVSVMAGECALGVLLRKIRYKTAAAVAAVPLVFALFLVGTALEGRFFSPPYTESFSYITATVEEDYTGEFYYDEEKNVVVLDGQEYPPEQAPNEDHLTGVEKLGAVVFEALVPCSGNGLALIRADAQLDLPAWAVCLYVMKAICWTVACALIPEKKEKEPAEPAE